VYVHKYIHVGAHICLSTISTMYINCVYIFFPVLLPLSTSRCVCARAHLHVCVCERECVYSDGYRQIPAKFRNICVYTYISTISIYIHVLIHRERESGKVSVRVCMHVCTVTATTTYGVATISRLLKIMGLFCKRAL